MTDPNNDMPQLIHVDEEAMHELLRGLLPQDETEVLLAHLRTCSQCDARFLGFSARYEAARAVPAPPRHGLVVPLRRKRWLRFTGLAAAALALLVLWQPWRQAPEELVYRIPSGREIVGVRSAADAGAELLRGIRAYDDHRLQEAVRILEGLQIEGPPQRFRDVYLAAALTELERSAAALTILDTLPAQRIPPPWRQETMWIHCIALLQAGRTEEAEALLQDLAEQPGDIGARAREQLQTR